MASAHLEYGLARQPFDPLPIKSAGFIGKLLVASFFLGFHLHFDIRLTHGLFVPAGLAGIAGLCLLIKNLGRIDFRESRQIACLVLLAFLTIVLNPPFWTDPHFQRHTTNYILSFIVFLYSLTVAYGVYLELSRWSLNALRKLFSWLLALVLVGCALELTTPLQALSDSVRLVLYDELIVYIADDRDLAAYGAIRPKLFTSEPSHVAKFALLCLTCWLITRERGRFWLLFSLSIAAAILIIRSPIVFLIFPILAAFYFDRSRAVGGGAYAAFVTIAVGLVVAPAVVALADATMTGRVGSIGLNADRSFFLRVIAPFEIALGVLRDHPILGLGFGAKEVGLPYAIDVYASGGHGFLPAETRAPLGNNAAALFLIQMGLFGGFLFFILFWRLIKTFAPRHSIFVLVAFFAMMNTDGGANALRLWGAFFLVFAVCRAHERSRER